MTQIPARSTTACKKGGNTVKDKRDLSDFQNVKKITGGMSGDDKYRVERDGKACLLRIADIGTYETKETEYAHLQHLNDFDLPVPECLAFGKTEDGAAVYTLLSWIEGEEAEKILPQTDASRQYACGRQAGQILSQIHLCSPAVNASKSWYERYFEVIEPRLEAYRKEGLPFEGCDDVLRFIEDNRDLLKTRPLCRHHGDYHMGNLIIHEDKLWVIDWQTVDFENIGDPWYEFNRLGSEYPAFARGQIDGYFADAVPEEFWRLFALYFATSAITSIVWAKHWAPKELDGIMALNRRVVEMFDYMRSPIPNWYREKEIK